MGKDRLDQYFKDQLYHHKTPTDPEAIWNNIQGTQSGFTWNRTLFYWLIPIVLLGLLSGLFFSLKSNQSEDNASTSFAVLNENEMDSQVDESEIVNNANNYELNQDNTHFQTQKNETLYANNSTQNVEKSALKNDISPLQNRTNMQRSNHVSANTFNPLSSKSPTVSSTVTADNQYSGNEFLSDQNKVISKEAENNLLASTLENETLNRKEEKTQSKENLFIPFLKTKNLVLTQKFEAGSDLWVKNRKASYFYRNSDWNFSIGAFGYYGLTDKKLAGQFEEVDFYLSQRNLTESSLEAVGFSVDLKASKWNNFYIKGGLSYTQINERFDLMDSRDTSYIDDNQIIRIVINSNGDSIPEFGPGLVTETYFFQKRIHNYYRFIDFPVTFGLQYSNGPLNYFIEAGASMNLLFTQKGEIFDENLEPYDIKSDNNNYFKSNAGLSLIGGFGIGYRINDYLSLTAQSQVKYQLSSVSSVENPISQKYILLGLQGGLRFHLGQ